MGRWMMHHLLCPISDFLDKWDGNKRCLCYCHRKEAS